MATSIASQLQAIRSIVTVDSDPLKRPFTCPSILFDAKEAADVDLDTIFSIARSALEVLVSVDERFGNYKDDLFSHKSRELDRELMGVEDNKRINASISSYLRLLSGYFQLPSAVKTLEYLIRRYKIHVHNTEELILYALPYHDTHVFVRIVQLLDTGNSKWKFLEGAKISGAPPPRKVIVQQCMRDMGVLEVLCNYASPTKKLQPARPAISFCTAVIVEVLSSLAVVDTDVVKRILPYVVSGLQIRPKGSVDHKAGALMIVGLLANRSALSTNLIKTLIRSIADVAREDAKESADLQSFRVSFMALINVVQLQSVELLPKKAVDCLKEIRDLSGVLTGLTKEFNVDKFLAVFLESLMGYSLDDDMCHQVLLSIIETVPLGGLVGSLVSKLLSTCMKLSKKMNETLSSTSVSKVKHIFSSVNKRYPLELRGAVRSFLEVSKVQCDQDSLVYEILGSTLDRGLNSSIARFDTKIWFGLEHPQAKVRQATIMSMDVDCILRDNSVDSQKFVTIQDALLRRLRDDDLSVVRAVLNMDRLSEIRSDSYLLGGLKDALKRCIDILLSGAPNNRLLAADVAVLCLEHAISRFRCQEDYAKEVAAMIFPLILVVPKTQRVNLKALNSAKELKWTLYQSLVTISAPDKKLDCKKISAVNMDNVNSMAEIFLMDSDEYTRWLVGCCHYSELSKTLSFLILLQSLMKRQKDFSQFSALYGSCFRVLVEEWEKLEADGVKAATKEPSGSKPDRDCKAFLDQLVGVSTEESKETKLVRDHIASVDQMAPEVIKDNHEKGIYGRLLEIKELNAEILVCLFWRFLEAFMMTVPEEVSRDESMKWLVTPQNLFVFFASHSKGVFKKHRHYLVTKYKKSPARFLSSLFTDEGAGVGVQIESLHSFAFLCSQSDEDLLLQLLAEFPKILVPLFSSNQDARAAAMSCINGLLESWEKFDFSRGRNGKSAAWSHFLAELLRLMDGHKMLILSDSDYLTKFLTSLLSYSHHSLLVPESLSERFDRTTKDVILSFILGSALQLCPHGILKILSLLKGVGCKVMLVKEVESLLSELLNRRTYSCHGYDESFQSLSTVEVQILCLLLECCTMLTTSAPGHVEDYILKALQVDRSYSEDPSIIQPCITVLRNLGSSLYGSFKPEIQELVFRELVFLFRSYNADVQDAARVALLHINITGFDVRRIFDFVLEKEGSLIGLVHENKKKKTVTYLTFDLHRDASQKHCSKLFLLSSLLDILLLKKDIENRTALIEPLFKLLRIVFMDNEWISEAVKQDEKYIEASSGISQTLSSTMCYIQQSLLSVLEDITNSLTTLYGAQDDIVQNFDIEMLVNCARCTSDPTTRNHVFSLLSATAKVMSDRVLEHILDILIVIGESAVTQWDSHSNKVSEDLISSVVPCWLSKTESPAELLQIFVNVLPNVTEHRRLSIIVHLLGALGESESLSSLLVLLFHSLASKQDLSYHDGNDSFDPLSANARMQWEYVFAAQICEQYSCMIWLPSVVALLQKIGMGTWSKQLFIELVVVMQFVYEKLEDPEIVFKLKSSKDVDSIQATIGELMEHLITLSQLVGSRRKQIGVPNSVGKELKERMHTVLTFARRGLLPSTFFKVTIRLLSHSDKKVRRTALGLLCEMAKECGMLNQKHHRKGLNSSVRGSWLRFDEITLECFEKMCLEILKLVDDGTNSSSLRLAAVSALENLAIIFPSNDYVFNMCLSSIIKNIHSDDLAVSSGCLRTVGAFINVLGPSALPKLPSVMDHVFRRCPEVSSPANVKTRSTNDSSFSVLSNSEESLYMSILVAIEAVIDKLGGFLNPYLGKILELVIVHPQYVNNSSSKLKTKADAVRKLITTKIPVRLTLTPLLKIYSEAIKFGDSSLSFTFEMLGNFIGTMDRSSISAYYVNIFDLCLLALDLRRQRLASVKNVALVEKDVINAMSVLTMKLTENMFKPLFIRCVEWSESYVEHHEDTGLANTDRAISFYGLVLKLVDSHRSLFVPYFKYLLDGLVRHLAGEQVAKSGLTRKKAKLLKRNLNNDGGDSSLSVERWHLRALVLSSLHKCFLYDVGNLEFLDSSNFQVLLKPIISQLNAEPPSSLEQHQDIPSLNEVDDLLVSCVGQMAVTSGSDLLWKPLNHEVLMQTRSEKVRTRILGLRIVKYLVENLREEYLVFLPETIPFLGELLEDVELSVKYLAQEILKEMETMSGESLRQYL